MHLVTSTPYNRYAYIDRSLCNLLPDELLVYVRIRLNNLVP